jgi:hypothetical protein
MRRAQLRGNILDMRPKVNALGTTHRSSKGVAASRARDVPIHTLDSNPQIGPAILDMRPLPRLRPQAAVAITPAPTDTPR